MNKTERLLYVVRLWDYCPLVPIREMKPILYVSPAGHVKSSVSLLYPRTDGRCNSFKLELYFSRAERLPRAPKSISSDLLDVHLERCVHVCFFSQCSSEVPKEVWRGTRWDLDVGRLIAFDTYLARQPYKYGLSSQAGCWRCIDTCRNLLGWDLWGWVQIGFSLW